VIPITQQKLSEAGFFLKKLTFAGQLRIGEEAGAFPLYLSAFLSAGRSVTFALQAEEKRRYDAWFPKWQASQRAQNRALLKFMNGQRRSSVHRGTAEVTNTVRLLSFIDGNPHEKREAGAFHGFPGFGPSVIHRLVRHFTMNGTPAEVVSTCTEYFKVLEELVVSFLKTHENPRRLPSK
jgi:hypothetical protein